MKEEASPEGASLNALDEGGSFGGDVGEKAAGGDVDGSIELFESFVRPVLGEEALIVGVDLVEGFHGRSP